ncbi:MAG: CHRD domain-containing protein [Gloeocapsa sp. UFS-A4-WI-NPMV-4B04]|jgi:hypothetical protein|nr:CHRD domain-containing protein [Gloeocapsa sp. UFS-A4-WI-NPMV-4B04]
MRQLYRLTIASIVGLSSFIAFNSSVESARRPPLSALLLGGNEVDAVTGKANAGDPDGVGSATIKTTRISDTEARLCYGITVSGLDTPVAAHIHEGIAGVNGPIVVELQAPATGTNASSGCVDVPLARAIDINVDPLNYYVNVHTVRFPGGAVRGQIH